MSPVLTEKGVCWNVRRAGQRPSLASRITHNKVASKNGAIQAIQRLDHIVASKINATFLMLRMKVHSDSQA